MRVTLRVRRSNSRASYSFRWRFLMARPNLTVYDHMRLLFSLTLLAMSPVLVFSQSASVATLERGKPAAELAIKEPANAENSTAAKLVAEGIRIEEPATADSKRKAIEKYLQAISLWQAAKDAAGEARTLALIASGYIILGEKQNAFDFAN